MRIIVAGQHAVSADECTELVLGIDPELFPDVADEGGCAKRVRLSVARVVPADLAEEDRDDALFVHSRIGRSTRRRLAGRRAA